MAWIKLRRFSWTTKPGTDGFPVVDTIKSVASPTQLPVDVSDLILTNALATTVSRPVLYDATLHELRLLGSYLSQAPYEHLGVREGPFRASALHIRRFVTESVGLGMLTASVQAAYRWYSRGNIHNVDVLPTTLAAKYRGSGPRPDLLFDTPGLRLAGEARGRSHNPPSSPSQPQYKRLNELLPWATRHGHGLVMTWAYLKGAGITVDWFAEDNQLPDLARQVGVPLEEDDFGVATEMAPREAMATMSGPEPGSPSHDPGLAREHTSTPERDKASASEERPFDETGPSELLSHAQRRVNQIEQRLFATAPTAEVPLRVAGRSLRGQWVPLDLIGAPSGSLLIGVLDSPLSQQASWEVTEGLRSSIRQRTESHETNGRIGQMPSDLPVAVSVRGRLFVAVASTQFEEPWDLFAD